jgi:hypothetical protein
MPELKDNKAMKSCPQRYVGWTFVNSRLLWQRYDFI